MLHQCSVLLGLSSCLPGRRLSWNLLVRKSTIRTNERRTLSRRHEVPRTYELRRTASCSYGLDCTPISVAVDLRFPLSSWMSATYTTGDGFGCGVKLPVSIH